MITYRTTPIQIKKTQNVEMYHDTEGKGLWLHIKDKKIFIPQSLVFQVLRGLLSWVQRFWRKKVKDIYAR